MMLEDDDRERLRSQLIDDEGIRLKPYRDTVGKLTIGCGRNLEDVGISMVESYVLLENDIRRVLLQLSARYLWLEELNGPRKVVICNMVFNMGVAGFGRFTQMLAALAKKDYDTAADEMMKSLWATQVRRRAMRLARMMRSGEWE